MLYCATFVNRVTIMLIIKYITTMWIFRLHPAHHGYEQETHNSKTTKHFMVDKLCRDVGVSTIANSITLTFWQVFDLEPHRLLDFEWYVRYDHPSQLGYLELCFAKGHY